MSPAHPLLALQRRAGNSAVAQLVAAATAPSGSASAGADTAAHLSSPRFKGDQVLEACFDDRARLQVGSSGAAVSKVHRLDVMFAEDTGAEQVDVRGAAAFGERDLRDAVCPDATLRDLTAPARSAAGPAVVEVVMSGEALSWPAELELDADDIAEAAEVRQRLMVLFAALAQTGPLYLGTAVEWLPPAPDELTLPERWLPGDLWWSDRLDTRDPRLRPDLEAILGVRPARLRGGHVIRAGGLLDVDAPVPDEPLAAGGATARRLALALALDRESTVAGPG